MKTFLLKPEHIKLLQNAYIGWDGCEFGAPAIDCKRPYGNSNVVDDIAEILGWGTGELTKEQKDYAHKLHEETQTALQILVQKAAIPWGTYTAEDYTEKWELQK